MSKHNEWASPSQTDPTALDYAIPTVFPPSNDDASQFHLDRWYVNIYNLLDCQN